MIQSKPMTIGLLAKASGVGVETIRFYERKGLVKKPPKNNSAFRYYSNEYVNRIQFVKRAQDLGFTLKEVKEILNMQVNAKVTCGDLKAKADLKIIEIEAKIKDLKHMKMSLQKFADTCGTKNVSIKECGILECFENGWKCN